MTTLAEAMIEVLGGIVGPVPAQMCLSAASVEIGKPHEALGPEDFDAIAQKIRTDMGRFASPAIIEQALAEIRAKL